MNKIILPLLIVGVILGIVGTIIISGRNKQALPAPSETASQNEQAQSPDGSSKVTAQTNVATLAIPLLPVAESGQMGRVELSEKSGNVEVVIEVTQNAKPQQAAAVRLGRCPTPGEVTFNLKSLSDGKSTSTIEKSMAELIPELPMAVVISDSAGSTNYTSCADMILPEKTE